MKMAQSKTHKRLSAFMAAWQWRLGLQLWDITLIIGDGPKGAHGSCLWDLKTMKATIKINKNKKMKEATIIHELLHLMLAEFTPKDGTAKYDRLEDVVATLEANLYNLAYGGDK